MKDKNGVTITLGCEVAYESDAYGPTVGRVIRIEEKLMFSWKGKEKVRNHIVVQPKRVKHDWHESPVSLTRLDRVEVRI